MQTRHKFTLSLSAFLASLVLAELGLILLDRPAPVPAGWLPPQTISQEERNQLSYRGQTINYDADDFVIVLLGDSQVEANTGARFDEMPERRLEFYLNEMTTRNVKVFSLGSQGYGQDQEMLALERYFRDYRADLILLWETPRNDVWNNIFPSQTRDGRYPKPTYWLEDGGLMGPTYSFGQNTLSNIRLLALLQLIFPGHRDLFWERRIPGPYRYEGEWPDEFTSLNDIWDVPPALLEFENLSTEKSFLAMHFSPRSARMSWGLNLTNTLLKKIQEIGHQNGAQTVFFTTEIENRMSGDHIVMLSGNAYRVSAEQFDQNVLAMNNDLPFVNLPVSMENWAVSSSDYHLNKTAIDLVMAELAQEVLAFLENLP